MRLFNLLKNILTLGNRFYYKNASASMSASSTTITIGSLTIPKPGTYLVASKVEFTKSIAAMQNNTLLTSGTAMDTVYTTRGTASGGGGTCNIRLLQLKANDTITCQTYGVGADSTVRCSIIAIRLLAGGGYFIGSPVWGWAYEIVHPVKADYHLEAKQDVAEAGEYIRRRNNILAERVYRNGGVCELWRRTGRPKHTNIAHTVERNKNALCGILRRRGNLCSSHKDISPNNNAPYRVYGILGDLRTVDWGCVA